MADLFRQEVILCAESPLSLTDGFKKLQIRVHDRAVETRTEALATTTTYVSDPDQELRLVKICHILSGLAGGSACIAIPYNETTIYVICEVILCLNRNCCQFCVHCYSLTVSICHSFVFSRLCCVPLASSHKQIVSCLLR